jgi:hypothetical protein
MIFDQLSVEIRRANASSFSEDADGMYKGSMVVAMTTSAFVALIGIAALNLLAHANYISASLFPERSILVFFLLSSTFMGVAQQRILAGASIGKYAAYQTLSPLSQIGTCVLAQLGVFERHLLPELLLAAASVSQIAAGIIILFSVQLNWRVKINKDATTRVVIRSIKMRAAHNVHNVLASLIIIAALSRAAPSEASSILFYKRILEAGISVIIFPLQRRMINLFIDQYNNFNNSNYLISRESKFTIFTYIVFSVASIFAIILGEKLNLLKFGELNLIALSALTASHIMISFSSIYASYLISINHTKSILIGNIFYTLVVFAAFIFENRNGVFLVTIAMFVGQVIIFLISRQFAKTNGFNGKSVH